MSVLHKAFSMLLFTSQKLSSINDVQSLLHAKNQSKRLAVSVETTIFAQVFV